VRGLLPAALVSLEEEGGKEGRAFRRGKKGGGHVLSRCHEKGRKGKPKRVLSHLMAGNESHSATGGKGKGKKKEKVLVPPA